MLLKLPIITWKEGELEEFWNPLTNEVESKQESVEDVTVYMYVNLDSVICIQPNEGKPDLDLGNGQSLKVDMDWDVFTVVLDTALGLDDLEMEDQDEQDEE